MTHIYHGDLDGERTIRDPISQNGEGAGNVVALEEVEVETETETGCRELTHLVDGDVRTR